MQFHARGMIARAIKCLLSPQRAVLFSFHLDSNLKLARAQNFSGARIVLRANEQIQIAKGAQRGVGINCFRQRRAFENNHLQIMPLKFSEQGSEFLVREALGEMCMEIRFAECGKNDLRYVIAFKRLNGSIQQTACAMFARKRYESVPIVRGEFEGTCRARRARWRRARANQFKQRALT